MLKIDTTSFFSAEGCPIWIKFWRLVQNDMSTAVMCSKSKPDVEFQYGGRSDEFSGMSSQSHVLHCRVLPVEFYLYPTVSTALVHSVKPKLTEYRTKSNSVNVQTELYMACMVFIRRIVTYKIFINKQLKHANVTIRLALYIYINIPVHLG